MRWDRPEEVALHHDLQHTSCLIKEQQNENVANVSKGILKYDEGKFYHLLEAFRRKGSHKLYLI